MFKLANSSFKALWISLLMLILIHVVTAQGSYQPIFESLYYLVNASWSNDSTSFVFQEAVLLDTEKAVDTGVITQNNNWHAYQAVDTSARMGSNNVVSGNRWFLEAQANSRGINIQLATSNYGYISFSFPSPDEEYLVYVAPKPTDWDDAGYPLAITRLETGETVFVPDVSIPFLSDFDQGYNITWSADSSAFTLEVTWTPVQFNFYISNFTQTLEEVSALRFLGPSQYVLEMNGQDFYNPHPLGLSPDGSQILLRGRVAGELQLYLWDVANPTNSQLIAKTSERMSKSLLAATFTGDRQQVLYIAPEGLMQYDLQSGQTTLLTPDVNSIWADRGWFSPDATKLALLNIADSPGYKHAVYVIDVPQN